MKSKIALVVPGRFHAFDLAESLVKRGHHVGLFTNYPQWVVQRFFKERSLCPTVHSCWPHAVATRVLLYGLNRGIFPYPEPWISSWFGNWAAREVVRESWDVVHGWSGFSEPLWQALKGKKEMRLLMRGSAHIKTQDELLEQEERRTGFSLSRPSRWMIEREEKEYALSDSIAVLSSFAYQTFLDRGIPASKLKRLPLGVSTEVFRPSREIVEARRQRILSGAPLRVLYAGTISFQKGFFDAMEMVRRADPARFRFRLVGSETAEVQELLEKMRSKIELVPKQPQQQLYQQYAWADLFIFPTIQDGFALVLAQANASALPILATTNCAASDLIEDKITGWILPIRQPEAFLERLIWCDTHRKELAEMVQAIYTQHRPRDWMEVARDFEKICGMAGLGD